MNSEQRAKLIQAAVDAKRSAYAPYSNFSVGAALLTDGGGIVIGCNVENASYGISLCAERTAMAKAVSEGSHVFQAIAISTADGGMPCGACLQFMAEFCDEKFVVLIVRNDSSDEVRELSFGELFPFPFRLVHAKTSATTKVAPRRPASD